MNAVAPGAVATEGNVEFSDPNSAFAKAYVAGSKLGRIGQPDDIAPAVVYFASNDSKWVTGEKRSLSRGASDESQIALAIRRAVIRRGWFATPANLGANDEGSFTMAMEQCQNLVIGSGVAGKIRRI